MLVVTEGAAEAVKAITEMSETRGVRITIEGDEISIDPAEAATDGDETITAHGATVWLDAEASEALADLVLDAHAHGDHFHFALEEQEAG